MPIFGGKEKNVFGAIEAHLDIVRKTLESFKELVSVYLEKDFEKAGELVKEVENHEREADTLRREIEMMLYEGAFLPASRGDYVSLVELIDKVADSAESAAHSLTLAKPRIPKELAPLVIELLNAAIKTYDDLITSVNALDEDVNKALDYAKKVEIDEEEADKIERKLLQKIFESEKMTTYAKIIWNEVITKIGDIADKAEDASDQVMLMAIKRRG